MLTQNLSGSLAARARREALVAALPADQLTLVPSGLPVDIPGTDASYPIRIHDVFAWAAGVRTPSAVLAGDGAAWTLFVPVPNQEDRVWHGSPPDLEALAAAAGVDAILPRAELQDWLLQRASRPIAFAGHPDFAERPSAYGVQPTAFERLVFDEEVSAGLAAAVVRGRLRKDAWELGRLRQAAVATAAGHAAGMRLARPGMTESALAIEIESAFRRAGATGPAYNSIVAGGPNSAVLHASPTARAFLAPDSVLVDAGAEVDGYDGDVTRVFPVAGVFEGRARDLYAMVLEVQERAVAAVRPGAEFRDLHMAASLGLAEGLVSLGVLRGQAEDLVATDAHAVFAPHGLGHMIGLATHDVGGYAPGRTRSDRPGLKYLRADVTLEAGMVLTIEPGAYFIPALLEDAVLRERHAAQVNFDACADWLAVGGVRIEDDVHVTAEGPEVLSAGVPKAIDAVEAACA